ncbi:hypothetical protein [Methylomonas sp. YC3]
MNNELESLRIQIVNLRINPMPSTGVTLRTPFNHTAFSLTLAKIGYCYAIAERGYDSFESTEIRDLLLGYRDDVYNFVGSYGISEKPKINQLHWLSLVKIGKYLVARVHLFASCGITPYQVVLGESR